MIKLEGILSFVAIVEGGSISEAARRLRLSKSVVSERLAELERILGSKLLHRTTRKLTLTEDGHYFLERAQRITLEIEEATTDMAERRGTISGPLRLSAPVTFGRMHLGPALYGFLADHPDLQLTLDLDDRRVDAAADGYDAVVRNGPIADSRLMAWRLAPSRRVLVASPGYLEKNGTPGSIEELETHKGIFYSNRGIADWRFPSPAGTILVRGRMGLSLNNGDMLRDAAIAGIGVALVPMFVVGTAIAAGELREIDIGVQPELEYIHIVHPDGRRPSAKLRAIADHLRQKFGTPPYWDRGPTVR
ncbi:DNA-binding transcriptional LysR family regulator [Pararhizobium capsulatum DSM 1112]|uniref:DNA-binding transcriptional LysR family regulator n=1 Tax=Pararhizobium capsulatum DSM 1112 TaxID=1121113 RepID=A0ABU0BPC2_9HYPH|nr:LysR family transcriptional regulator [Pararhizobium capsulatum]MDQ0320100.1 DNA-binding transcriptional LysR family regulator [Pararhizobium capsulatum DSM 1112]